LSHGAVSHLELGIRMPAAATVEKIARALGVEPGELYRGPVPLAEAPEAGQAGPTEPLDEDIATLLLDVLNMSAKELEKLRIRAREDYGEYKTLDKAQLFAWEFRRVAEKMKEPQDVLAKVKQRDRTLFKVWHVVWCERNYAGINESAGRSPDAPVYSDTAHLSLDDAYDVWRNVRVPAGAR
jgi:transcriptional regulator with XRE-family HTH domain